MTVKKEYTLVGGQKGRERLRILARACRSNTLEFLKQTGLKTGDSCLDAGCGGGDVTVELSRIVGASGSVLGLDVDKEKLAIAQAETRNLGLNNIDFQAVNLMEWSSESVYDMAYSRFLFSHISKPESVLAEMVNATKPGGIVAIEDIDFSSSLCYPPSAEYDLFVELYRALIRRNGADPHLGLRLHSLMVNAGLKDIQVSIVQPVQGEAKILAPLSFKSVKDALLSHRLISEEKLDTTIDALYRFAEDPNTAISMPRVVQVWGRK